MNDKDIKSLCQQIMYSYNTNKMFEKPAHCHFELKNFDYQNVIKEIRDKL